MSKNFPLLFISLITFLSACQSQDQRPGVSRAEIQLDRRVSVGETVLDFTLQQSEPDTLKALYGRQEITLSPPEGWALQTDNIGFREYGESLSFVLDGPSNARATAFLQLAESDLYPQSSYLIETSRRPKDGFFGVNDLGEPVNTYYGYFFVAPKDETQQPFHITKGHQFMGRMAIFWVLEHAPNTSVEDAEEISQGLFRTIRLRAF